MPATDALMSYAVATAYWGARSEVGPACSPAGRQVLWMSMGPSALVVAVGDAEAGRDAVGPLILAQMLKEGLPPTVTACSIGRRPDRLPDVVARDVADGTGLSLLVLLDAVTSATEPPGTLVEREMAQGGASAVSSHDLALHDAVGLLDVYLEHRAPPRIVLVGIVVGRAADGSMPDVVAGAIPSAAARARKVLESATDSLTGRPPG